MKTSRDDTETNTVKSLDAEAVERGDQSLTPLQEHYLSLLQRLISLKNSYQTDPNFEQWMLRAINKAIYSALRDCIESDIGDMAKQLLHQEHQVN
ncbi:MAG TPA: hypothetical protein VI855_08145 [Dehalococcoidia bacterium]|nr:hypothetical protein [Dehalococcoidia bacterium]